MNKTIEKKKETDPRENWEKVTDESDTARLVYAQRHRRVRPINQGQFRAVRGK